MYLKDLAAILRNILIDVDIIIKIIITTVIGRTTCIQPLAVKNKESYNNEKIYRLYTILKIQYTIRLLKPVDGLEFY